MQASENVSPVPRDLDARAERQRVGRADRVRVEAGAGGDVAAARAAVAEMHRHAVVGMADDGEQRAADRAAAELQLDDVGDDLAVLAALNDGVSDALSFSRGRRADEHRVVPGQPRDRLRQLLQPAVVGEAAVEDRRVVAEGDLEAGSPDADCGLRVERLQMRIALTVFGANAVSGITPSCSQRRHASNRPSSTFQMLADDSYGGPFGPVAHRGEHSCADLPP